MKGNPRIQAAKKLPKKPVGKALSALPAVAPVINPSTVTGADFSGVGWEIFGAVAETAFEFVVDAALEACGAVIEGIADSLTD